MRASVLVGEIFVLLVLAIEAQSEPLLTIKQVQTLATTTCVLFDDGRITCWGGQNDSALGLGDIPFNDVSLGGRKQILSVDLGEPATQFAGYASHACARLESGKAKCWGTNNNFNLGIADKLNRGAKAAEMGKNLPYVEIPDEEEVVHVEVGNQFSLALTRHRQTKKQSIWQWGTMVGDTGQIPAPVPSAKPVQLAFRDEREPVAMDAGYGFACALMREGSVICWGINSSGQLGMGDKIARGYSGIEHQVALQSPIELGSDSNGVALQARSLSLGDAHACVELSNDQAKCWGSNAEGQLGITGSNIGSEPLHMGNKLAAVPVLQAGESLRGVAAFANTSCAFLYNGSARCWGFNYDNVSSYEYTEGLPDPAQDRLAAIGSPYGGSSTPFYPLSLGPLSQVEQVVGAEHQICAIVKPAKLTCWGMELNGILGLRDLEYAQAVRLKARDTKFPLWLEFTEGGLK